MKHIKKMIAPVIAAMLVIVYYLGIAYFMTITDEIPQLVRIIFIILPILFVAVMIAVLIGRIKEIRSGEEDDLSQY